MTDNYNRVYTWGRMILQVQQKRQNKGIAVDLLPGIVVGIANNRILVGLGFEWLTGTVNIGVMTAAFVKSEKDRLEHVYREASKAGLTVFQYQNRWDT